MDSSGPTPDAATGTKTPPRPSPPTSATPAPATPAPSTPAPADAPAGPAASPSTASAPTAPATPAAEPLPMRRGLFGSRGPMTPEVQLRVARSRSRILGFSMVALSVLMLLQITPALFMYENLVETGLTNAPGGNLVVEAMPADAGWSIVLKEHGSDKAFANATTDASGRASFTGLAHAVFTLQADRNGTSPIKGALYVPTRENHTLAITTTTASTKWLNGTPQLPQAVAMYLGALSLVFAIGAAGGVAAILRRWLPLAVAGAASFAGAGLALILLGGGIGFFQIAIMGLGVWAFITFRKNPAAFAQAPKEAPTQAN